MGIEGNTLGATVVVIPAPFDGGTQWMPTWHIAPDGYSDRYCEAVHINSDEPRTEVASWIADVTVGLDAVDAIIAEVAGS